MPTQNRKDDCCCCLESHYEQNQVLKCRHPLRSRCYRQMPTKMCPMVKVEKKTHIFQYHSDQIKKKELEKPN